MDICGLCRRAARWDESLVGVQVNPSPEQPSYEILVSAFGVEQCQGTVGMRACSSCAAKLNGLPPPEPRRWPHGKSVPTIGEGMRQRDIDICGICRLALRQDDQQTSLRLWPEDIWAEAEAVEVGQTAVQVGDEIMTHRQYRDAMVEPGGYRACSDCLAKYRPRIAARLRRLGLLAEHAPDSAVGGDLLL